MRGPSQRAAQNSIRGRGIFARAQRRDGSLEELLRSIGIGEEWHATILSGIDAQIAAFEAAENEQEDARLRRLAAEAEAKRLEQLARMRSRAAAKAEAMGRGGDTWLVDKLVAEEVAEMEGREAVKRAEEAAAAAAEARRLRLEARMFAGGGAVVRVEESFLFGVRTQDWRGVQRGVGPLEHSRMAQDGTTAFGMDVFFNARTGETDIVSPEERARLQAEEEEAAAEEKAKSKALRKTRRDQATRGPPVANARRT